MFVNSLTTVGIANQVWAQAARTLTNPSGVFSDAVRTLTSFGTGPLVILNAQNGSVAASATVQFTSSAGLITEIELSAIAAAAGTMTYAINDATNLYTWQTVNANNAWTQRVILTGTQIVQLHNNDGANAGKYTYTAAKWVQ